MNPIDTFLAILTDRFPSVPIRGLYVSVQWLFILIDAALAVCFVYVVRTILKLRYSFDPPKGVNMHPLSGDTTLPARWASIREKVNTAPPQSYALAIIEADAFTDSLLKRLSVPGDDMGARLDTLKATGNIPSLDRLWRVHRVRNEIAHNPNYRLDARSIEEYLDMYEAFLMDIGALGK
jgi:hypothetical protein